MDNLTFEQLPAAVSLLTKEVGELKRLVIENREQQSAEYPPEQLFTVQEVAQFLNLTVPTIYSKVSKGELPVMKRSKRLYFSSIELLKYLKEGRKMLNTDIKAEADEKKKKKKGGEHE